MLQPGDQAPPFSLLGLNGTPWRYTADGKPTLLIFLETDCPTCRLTLPYLNRLAQVFGGDSVNILGISQDGEEPTRALVEQFSVTFPVVIDRDLSVSRLYDPIAVPTLFLLDRAGTVARTQIGFDKKELNAIGAAMSRALNREPLTIADAYDGAPETKPGCTARHKEMSVAGDLAAPTNLYAKHGARTAHIALDDGVDPYEYCRQAGFADSLPVVPPTVARVERMLEATSLPPEEIIGWIAPNYGAATVEKIAANAVMAGCAPEMMRVLIPLVRAACDERFNLHGVQATTHFAAPLILINGPIRNELGFAYRSNVFSNVARANSTVGRALQLILVNLGGARPGEIDMSTLGNPGKFSYCVAENEEENPWEPLHVELGFTPHQSALTLFAAEPPRGVSEHNARQGRQVLKAISRALATVWTYRFCGLVEAMVVLCPEHVKTLARDGFTKPAVREFLFQNTGIPIKAYQDDGGEGTQYVALYQEVLIDGEPCYRKFLTPDAIKIVVAGGTAGKFSAVIGSWAAGPRGSQMVTYPISD
jgi:peroxiredoxin